jgi:Ca2+-transporting ATPase
MVLTIFMALGALRLARRNVLVRRSAVIETLGATDLLCVDKTGTLTENRMRLRYLWSEGVLRDLDSATPKGAEPLLTAARGASTAQGHDPMDVAINAMAGSVSGEVIRTYPLSARLLAFVQVWRLPNDRIVYAAKGAHDVLLPLCRSAPEIDDAKRVAQELAEMGARVLAVAAAEFEADPQSPPDAVKFRLVGLLGFEDPVREDVPAAIEAATRAGVSVAMITGDYPATAAAIGAAAGIDVSNGVLTGEDVERLDELPSNVWVFARTKPEQKLALVRKFKRSGHVVAMTGDGVNDGPALAAADVGIAMGQRGTDVAREAADLILLDDRFASIVGGIALGRRIFANLQRAMTFITAAHIPIAGLALLPLLLGLPPLFYPMHIVLLELIFDPLCSIVFEGDPGRSDVMAEPPRKPSERLFGIAQVRLAAIQGTILMLCILGYYMWLHRMIPDDALARSCAFLALVIGQLSLALAEGSAGGRLFSRQRIAFWSIAVVAALLLALTMTVPFLVALLRFEPPPLDLLLVSILIGGVAGGWSGPVLTYRAGRGARRSEAQSK